MSSLEEAQRISYITGIYQFCFNIFTLSIGLISNLSIIIIFTNLRMFQDNRSAYYLSIESTTNIGLILAMIPTNIISYQLGYSLTRSSIVWCKIQLMSSYSCGLHSLFSICFLALDQYLSTNYRQSWRQKSTMNLAHRLIIFNIIIALFHGTLFLIFAEIGPLGCYIYHPIIRLYFIFFFYPILSGIFPLITSSLLSLLAYRNVRRIIRRQIPLTRRRLDRQMTAFALARVICIGCLATPFIVFSLVNLLISNENDDFMKKSIFNLISVIVESLLYFNFAINFYIFLIVSPRFRNQVKHFFVKKCWRPLTRLCHTNVTVIRNSQVAPEPTPRHISIVESV